MDQKKTKKSTLINTSGPLLPGLTIDKFTYRSTGSPRAKSKARAYNRSINQKSQSLSLHPEVFVDASNLGIGLILESRWLAWKFNQSSPYIPRDTIGRIDTSWSELIAVELGVRTLIAAGFRSTTVRIRSDNTSVVNALERRTWGKIDRLTTVLMRITELCDGCELDLKAEWVVGGKNPADAPSRGRFPPREQLLMYPPPIPEHLESFITLFENDHDSIHA